MMSQDVTSLGNQIEKALDLYAEPLNPPAMTMERHELYVKVQAVKAELAKAYATADLAEAIREALGYVHVRLEGSNLEPLALSGSITLHKE
jgi:hypothetical protein